MPMHVLKYPPMVSVFKLSVYVCGSVLCEVLTRQAGLGYMQTDL